MDVYHHGAVQDDDSLVEVDSTGSRKYVRVSIFGDVAWQSPDSNFVFLNGVPLTWAGGGTIYGAFPLAFDQVTGFLYAQFDDDLTQLRVFNLIGEEQAPVPVIAVSAEGIKSVIDGEIIFFNAAADRRVMDNGETWIYPVETENYVVGQVAASGYPYALGRYVKATGAYQRWFGASTNPHHALEHNGSHRTYISGPSAPGPSSVSWVDEAAEGQPTGVPSTIPEWEGYGGGGSFPGVRTLEQQDTFEVASATEEVVTLTIQVYPAAVAGQGQGRLIHPILGSFDYEVKPDEWENLDSGNVLIPPMWSSARGLITTVNTLWAGLLKDVVVEERWKSLGGLAMPITQLRMLMSIWTNPLDPDVGYVRWYPNYASPLAWKVLPVDLKVGGEGIALDDVINYKDEGGNPVGWVTSPVTFQMKLVEPV